MTSSALIVGLINGTNDVILGLVAATLVAFSLVVSLVVPRRWPDFPGRNLKVFTLAAVLLVGGMLAAVEALGESHHFGAAHSEEAADTGAGDTGATTTAPATETGQTGTGETGAAEPAGDPTAGKGVFASSGCSSCHTLEAAGSTATIGPDLDKGLAGKDADFIRESIVNPDADVTEGFSPDLMPETYGDQLSDKQLGDLVAFLADSTG